MRDPIGDPIAGCLLAERRKSVGAGGPRGRPGAGGVENRAGGDPFLVAEPVDDVHGEQGIAAAGVDDAVAPRTGDPGHGGAGAHARAQGVGERSQVAVDPLASGRVPLGRLDPSRALEQAPRGGVDEFGPSGEQPHVPPLRDSGGRGRAALEHEDVLPALDEVRGGGEALRPRTDDDDGQFRHQHSSD